jgi:apolipoprotein N-acyltransferase
MWILVLVSFVPLLIAIRPQERYMTLAILTYITFLVLHLITAHWALASQGILYFAGGTIFLLGHPLLFVLPMAAWHFLRKRWPGAAGLAFFPFVWVAFEYVQSFSGIATPLYYLGNSQSSSLETMQLASLAGVRGLTFWITIANVVVFGTADKVLSRQWPLLNWRAAGGVLATTFVILLPPLYGVWALKTAKDWSGRRPGTSSLQVAIVQPDIDPLEKWSTHARSQIQILLDLSKSLPPGSADLIVWPETAIPLYILMPENRGLLDTIRNVIRDQQSTLLTGFTDWRYYGSGEIVPRSSKRDPEGRRYDIYNAAMVLKPGQDTIQKYRKIILLPIAERAPFAEALSILNIDVIRWNFGTGGYGIGTDTTVFESTTSEGIPFRFGTVICFESLFPEFVREFVDRGAQFLVVITNDSWWGRSSGPYQHAALARLRAVENRRWVLRSANGGISSIIDPWGRVVRETPLFSRTVFVGSVELHDEKTFYTRHGDWLALMCLVVTLALLGAAGVSVLRGAGPQRPRKSVAVDNASRSVEDDS